VVQVAAPFGGLGHALQLTPQLSIESGVHCWEQRLYAVLQVNPHVSFRQVAVAFAGTEQAAGSRHSPAGSAVHKLFSQMASAEQSSDTVHFFGSRSVEQERTRIIKAAGMRSLSWRIGFLPE
jgi:hypothetical protein